MEVQRFQWLPNGVNVSNSSSSSLSLDEELDSNPCATEVASPFFSDENVEQSPMVMTVENWRSTRILPSR
jgi:hypothetical protein